MDVFCVFEGGGAKGVAHVGFLRAIDKQEGYTARGYAGTSAGAIVAALAAVGWKGEELFEFGDNGIESYALDHLAKKYSQKFSSLADLLDRSDWRKLSLLKEQLNKANIEESGSCALDLGKVIANCVIIFVLIITAIVVVSTTALFLPDLFPAYIHFFGFGTSLILLLLTLFSAAAGIIFFSWRFSGIASMDGPQDKLETLLQHKLPQPDGSAVTFRHILDQTGHSLKIVAADLENGNLKLFGTDTTPDVSVSRAVAASAAIPLLFKPVLVEGRQYCDGGIVSNLPAWTFDSERLNNEDCLTITCEVSPPKDLQTSRPRLRGLRLFTRFAVTTLFGGSDLNTRGMLRHLPLSAWHSIRMLDLEKSKQQTELIQASEDQANIMLDLERLHRTGIEGLRARITDMLAQEGIVNSTLRVDTCVM